MYPESVGKMWMSRGTALYSRIYKKEQAYPLGRERERTLRSLQLKKRKDLNSKKTQKA